MLAEQRKLIFDAAKRRGAIFRTRADVADLDAAIDAAIGLSVPSPERRTISQQGIELIKRFEGLRLKAYRCPADVLTIGYGSTGPHVKMGMMITAERAEELLREDLIRFEDGVAKLVGDVSQNEFDALVSFSFNVGLQALRNSTLLKKHMAGDKAAAALQFARWNKAGGKVLPGLVKRRAAEAHLYLGGIV